MENLQQHLEELREVAKQQFNASFADSLHAQIYREWSGIMKHTGLNPYTKMILMRMIEIKYAGESNFQLGQLHRDLKMNRKSVATHVQILEDMGLCKKYEKSNWYQITLNKVF